MSSGIRSFRLVSYGATTYSLLNKGLPPTRTVPCPKSLVVDGKKVVNYEGESLGQVPFSKDFAHSCNTAFTQLASTMGDSDVHDAAAALGVGAGWDKHLGIAGTFGGSVPVATSKTDRAATAFGQGRTEVSPASLAVMAASVARGSFIEPALIRSPAVPGADRTPKPLTAKTAGQLRDLMRLAVLCRDQDGRRVYKRVIPKTCRVLASQGFQLQLARQGCGRSIVKMHLWLLLREVFGSIFLFRVNCGLSLYIEIGLRGIAVPLVR